MKQLYNVAVQLHALQRGAGTPTLLIHGSATDHTTWSVQLASLTATLAMLACDRRGSGRSAGPSPSTVAAHATDAADLVRDHLGGRALVVGSSFGAVVALELARCHPDLASGLVLCEPPLPCHDDAPAVPQGFGCDFDALCTLRGGEAAAELFLRGVLGDDAFDRMPVAYRQRSTATWRAIRDDCAALARYRPDYPSLSKLTIPVALIGGTRSAPFYRDTLETLHASLPTSTLHILQGAGHMMHTQAHRPFAKILRTLATRIT